MKIYYVANLRLPTWKAHGIQIMKTCEALAKHQDIELVATRLSYGVEKDPFKYYGVEKTFKIARLWSLDTAHYGWLGFWLGLVSFTLSALLYVLPRKGVFYTRDEFGALLMKIFGKKVVWEAHTGQKNIFVKMLIRLHVPIVVISNGLKLLYVSMGVPEDMILVAHDGVDLKQFNLNLDRRKIREELGLSLDNKLAVYTGSRYAWKGASMVEDAAALLPDGVKTMVITGKSYLEIPKYLQAADVLILPNSAKDEVSKRYTSPMKLFEYMASGIPIVASDLPSLREVLNESNSYFFTPDDAQSLAKMISSSLADPSREKKARQALDDASQYTWDKRAEVITNFINTTR